MTGVPARAAVSIALAGLIAVAAISLLRTKPAADGVLPADCGAIPSAYHPGAIIDWPGSGGTAAKSADAASAAHFARVRFDSGRKVLVYDATPERSPPGTRVVVAEIRCVHRTIYMLTEFGAPAAPVDRQGASQSR